MPYNVVAINHQTFLSSSLSSNSNSFRFTKVYKTNVKQRFIVKPIALSWFHDTDKQKPQPNLFFVRGLPRTNGELVVQSTANQTNSALQENKNKTLLGVLGGGLVGGGGAVLRQGHANQIVPPEFMFDEIPLDDFTIEMRHLDETTPETSNFMVSFQIETVENYL